MIRASVLAALFILCALPAPAAGTRAALAAHVHSILGMLKYKHSDFGLAIYDMQSGRSLYALNADRYFLAASTTKLLTEGAALALLDSQYRFRTNVFRTGPVDLDGTLHGDLVLVASGDPNLSARLRANDTLAYENEDHSYDGGSDTKAVPGHPLLALHDFATQIAAQGIRRVTGSVHVDDSLYKAGFPEVGTGAVVSPIMVSDTTATYLYSP